MTTKAGDVKLCMATSMHTVVRYEWCVHTTRAWMNALAPLLRPVFQWHHDAVMREGGAALARQWIGRSATVALYLDGTQFPG
ncbi:hypothetical protein [Caballeronia sp. KNU42]